MKLTTTLRRLSFACHLTEDGGARMVKLKLRRGDSHNLTFEILEDGVALNLTPFLIRLTAKTSPDDADSAALFRLSSTWGGIVKLATAGRFLATLLPGDTTNMAIGQKMYFDVQLTNAGGEVVTPFYGQITIVADVTKNSADVGTDV